MCLISLIFSLYLTYIQKLGYNDCVQNGKLNVHTWTYGVYQCKRFIIVHVHNLQTTRWITEESLHCEQVAGRIGFIIVRDSPLYMYTIYKEMDNREKSAMGPGSRTYGIYQCKRFPIVHVHNLQRDG
jgi:hypothetical protein